MKYVLRTAAVALLTVAYLSCAPSPEEPDEQETEQVEAAEPVELRILGFNDFHGALEGPTGSMEIDGEDVELGGARYFASHLDDARDGRDHATVVHAGDLIGASPLISSLFYDEPTIEFANEVGLDIAGVGNHEFDRGVDELLRIVDGGCHPDEGCREGYEYPGVEFPFLAANVVYRDTGETILPPYEIRDYDGITVGYVGMTLENTPQVVVPSAIESVRFQNEVQTVERYLPDLRQYGVDTIVVVVHEGGVPTGGGGPEDCEDVEGRIGPMAEEMPDEVSVIVSGHTHSAYVCEFGGKLVTQAGHAGRLITAIDLSVDPTTGEVVDTAAEQIPVTRDIEPDEAVASLVDEYAELAAPLADEAVGEITAEFSRGPRSEAGASPMGRVIADAQLEATKEESGAQIALMNPGGIRDALGYDPEEEGEPAPVTYRDLHTIQPFANILITMTLSGQQIHDLLEQQWREDERDHVLAISSGFTYRWDPEAPVGERVDPASIQLDGEPIEMDEEYRVTVNNFMADGGDGFTILEEGTERVGGMVDLDALADYFRRHSPMDPPQERRIVRD